MAPTVSKEAAVTTAVVATVAVVAGVGYMYRERTQAVARSTYDAVSVQASAAAMKGAEVAKALQASVVSGCNTVASSAASGCNAVASTANSALESVTAAFKKAKSQRSLRRVRSFPIVADEDDVAAATQKDQKDQKKKKVAKAVKKATQEAEQMGVPVKVMAK